MSDRWTTEQEGPGTAMDQTPKDTNDEAEEEFRYQTGLSASPTRKEVLDEAEDRSRIRDLAREAATRLVASRFDDPVTGPLARLLETLANYLDLDEEYLAGEVSLRLKRVATAVLSLPAGPDSQPGDATAAGLEQVLLRLNNDPHKPPRTAWYADVVALGDVERVSGVRQVIRLMRLDDDAAWRADLLDEFDGSECYPERTGSG